MFVGLRAPLTAQPIVPKALMYVAYVGLLLLFVYGLRRSWETPASLLYVVAIVFMVAWPVSHRVTVLTSHPVYLVVVSPVCALLLGQLATSGLRAVTIVALVGLVSVVTLHRMDVWFQRDEARWPPAVPRSFAPLAQELDRLGVDRVYANYWVAYRLAFDTRERIVAAQNPYTPLAVEHGRLVPFPDPRARYQPFQRDVRASSHGFVYFRYDPIPRRVLTEHGYRRHLVGPFAVYARG